MSNPGNWAHKLRVLESIGVPIGSRVLDYGCGAGATVQSLADAGFDAFGFDVLDYIERPSNRIAVGSPGCLPYPDGHFDMVFSDHVFEHALDEREYMAASSKPNVRRLPRLIALPGVLALIRTFVARIVVLQKPWRGG